MVEAAQGSSRRMFGTDGIRGEANAYPMTPEVAMRAGMAVAAHFGLGGRVVVGKDTRLSGYLIESALASGLAAMGATALLVGPMPTPGIAYLTHSMRAQAGVVISASHNQFADNGIKIFGAQGYKLPDEVEAKLEADMAGEALDEHRARGAAIGRAFRIDDAAGRYITRLKQAFPTGDDLTGFKIVIDCSHGAAYKIAPTVLEELGATVITRGVSPNGTNINDGVGATHPQALCEAVKEAGADIGIALDGDADRSIFSDENGAIVDGDAIMAMCARDLHQRGDLQGGAVVATVMSNLGLERSLAEVGISLVRTPVGDRYVVQAMRGSGCNLGGEQSGHLVFLDHATTGDGMVAALQVLTIMRRTGSPLSRLSGVMSPVPQRLSSFMVPTKVPIDRLPKLQRTIRTVERELGDEGRVLVRYSGTEKKMRVMVEFVDAVRIDEYVSRLQEVAVAELGALA
ncbi:MAG: phosphoglucosamine mutase [Nannocystaceae bacterium]|nr:phosphoglucosamine mutase [Nannocystaceae bacterium]